MVNPTQHTYRHHRRQFLKSFVFLGSAAAASARKTAARETQGPGQAPPLGSAAAQAAVQSSPQDARPEPRRVFDAHLHCPSEGGNVWQWYPVTRTFDEFARYLDRCGVERGIINNVRCQEAKTPSEFIAGNREVARYVDRYQGRFLGACVVNPTFIEEALREIEDCRKQLGFVWVGELCNYETGWKYSTKEFELLVQQVERLNMVLDVHTELEEMEYIIQKCPQATIVFPHFGDSHEGSHIFKRIDLVARNRNCYIDTSGYGHDRMGMLEYAVKTVGAERVLFGSDFSINDPGTVIARINRAFLTPEQRSRILGGNLQALLKKVQA